MATAYVTHPDCLLHRMASYHPEAPERLQAIQDQLVATGLFDLLRHLDAPEATREQLERVHERAYIDALEALHPAPGRLINLDPDTAMGEHSLAAARRAAGAAVIAAERVFSGEVENAFCAVRPPGHHAEPSRAMGFCLFNNIAVGVAHALEKLGLERIAIVDFDVHHGNGTEVMFRDDARVLMCSSFQHPFYPYTEIARDRPRLVQTPLAAGTGSAGFRAAVEQAWLPALNAFRPQMVFVSAGFDGHAMDELGQLRLIEADFGWVTERVCEVARAHAGGRVVSVLEGGYALGALGRSAALHIRALMGIHE